MNDPITRSLEVPGATLQFDVRGDLENGPVLLMAGSPMDAVGFGTLASFFTDRPVVTYDPRGTGRSVRTGGAVESTPEMHGDDLHRLIETLDVGAVDLFGSSGGAVNGLALVASHPEAVGTLVAHEPAIAQVLPDREHALAANQDVVDTYQRSGLGPAMAKFFVVSSHTGPFTPGYFDEPDPDPAAFGLPTDDDGSRDDVLLGQNLRTSVSYQPDFDALASASTRIVVAAGEESEGQLAARAAAAIAERLGTELVVFPSDHGGFLGGEYGGHGQPEEFAEALRRALAAG